MKKNIFRSFILIIFIKIILFHFEKIDYILRSPKASLILEVRFSLLMVISYISLMSPIPSIIPVILEIISISKFFFVQ